MLFVLVFLVLAVALPAIGEVWSHGKNNVFARGGREIVVVVEPYLATLEESLQRARKNVAWLTVLAYVIWFARKMLDLLAHFIARITGVSTESEQKPPIPRLRDL
jgi:CBS domain containing-hemolysin-like protein